MSEELKLAEAFHETYERLAPQYGYETRPETRTFDPNSNNGRLMIAVCREVCEQLNRRAAPDVEALCATLEMRAIGYSQSSTAFDHGKGTASHLRGLAEGLREAQYIIREDAKGGER